MRSSSLIPPFILREERHKSLECSEETVDFCHPLKEHPRKNSSVTGHSSLVMLSAPQRLSGVFLQTNTTLVEPWRPNGSACFTKQMEGTLEFI